jgi:integrator complex subunit 11
LKGFFFFFFDLVEKKIERKKKRRGEKNFFSSRDIHNCLSKVIAMSLHQRVQVDETLEVTAYYAGHVLGAAMFEIRVGEQSVVYTGDFNMTPDRHLGAAWLPRLRPSLLVTESTYCTFVRDSKRVREKDFLARVHAAVERGGKGFPFSKRMLLGFFFFF